MFYEFNTFDPLGNAPWKRSERTAGDGTFKGDMAELAQVYLALNPDAKLNYQEPANAAKLSQAQSAAAAVEVSDILPDGLVIPPIVNCRISFGFASNTEI